MLMTRLMLETLAQDLRYAARRLARDRGFTLAATLILAIGIGACTAMFSIVHAVLLRPFAVRSPERIMMLWAVDTRHQAVGELTYSARRDMLGPMQSFGDIALVGSVNWSGTLRIPGAAPVALSSSAVSGSFFEVLGASALLGRTLNARDDEPSAAPVIVLSHATWTQYFGGDPGVIGRKVPMGEGTPALVEVVGVMPPDFFFPRGVQYWTPAAVELSAIAAASGDPLQKLLEGVGVFYGVGRLKPEAHLGAAREEAAMFVKAEAHKHQVDLSSVRIQMTPLLDHMFGRARDALVLLMAAVAMVLLIACGNVAGLLFARGVSRARETAVRAALGASRGALTRQMLIESALIAAVGSAAGVLAATLALNTLVGLSPADIPRLDSSSIDATVLAFAIACAAITTLAVGLGPALRLSRPTMVEDLKGGSTGVVARSGTTGTRRWLMGMQVAGTLVLLMAAGLCLRSFTRLNRQDLGFNPRNVLTFSVSGLNKERYPAREARYQAIQELVARFERLPQVSRAAAVLLRPFEHGPIGMDTGVVLEGQPDTPATAVANPVLNWEWITSGYFDTMKIPLLRGRGFDVGDTSNAPLVAIVSAATAIRLWPGQDPIGKRFHLSLSKDGEWHTVVGVVGTARYREIDSPRFDLYVPLQQADSDGQFFMVRTNTKPLSVAPAIAADISAFDKGLSADRLTTMDAIVRRTQGPWRFNMLVFGLFGSVALGLAAVGLFALVAFDVAQRTREIGLRIALGAARGDVVRLMIWQGAKPSAIGLIAGVLAALLLTRLLSQFLFEITPTDPVTFVSVVVLLGVVIVLASYLPARRAAAIDPQVVLRDM
jgi:putative ABC transport system permease protein